MKPRPKKGPRGPSLGVMDTTKDPHGGRGPHDGAGGTWDKKNGGPHTGGPEPF